MGVARGPIQLPNSGVWDIEKNLKNFVGFVTKDIKRVILKETNNCVVGFGNIFGQKRG